MARRPSAVRTRPGLLGRSGVHLATFALVVLSLGLLVNFTGQVAQSASMESERVKQQAEVERLRAEIEALRARVAYVESDVYAEQVAREQLVYAREGDVVLLLLEAIPTAAPEAPAATPAPLPPPTPNWLRWWQALFP